MPAPPWIPIIAGLAVVAIVGVALLTSLVRGQPVDVSTLALIAAGWGGGVAITTFVLRMVDRRLWRSVLFRRLPLPNAPPVLHGTWAIKITTVRSKDSPAPTRPIGYLVIEQQFSTISATVLFDMGTTEVIHAILTKRGKRWELWYIYDFRPRMGETENPHRSGAATLRVSQQGMKLEGDYWNELGWKGTIESTGFVKQTFDDFGSADRHFRAAASSLPSP